MVDTSTARALLAAALGLGLLGVIAVATHRDGEGTSLAVQGPAPRSAVVASTPEAPAVEPTIAVTVAPPETSTTATTRPAVSTTLFAPTTTAPAACGPRPAPLASGPGDTLARFWIENTSAIAGGSVWVGNSEPVADPTDPAHDVAPCETVGPFSVTPQFVISGGEFGSDSIGIDQNGCGWVDNDFMFVPDHQYVVVMADDASIDPAACGVPDPPTRVLRARIWDLVTGEEVQIS